MLFYQGKIKMTKEGTIYKEYRKFFIFKRHLLLGRHTASKGLELFATKEQAKLTTNDYIDLGKIITAKEKYDNMMKGVR